MTETSWPGLHGSWITPESALHDWRDRIARVEAQETAHFANLPYVTGVAVIGSVGRGTQWPLSDLDLLVVADFWEGEDPEWLIRREEEERIRRLHAAGIPNDVEAGNWVLTTDEVRAAMDGDDDTFLKTLDHGHWLGIAIKAEGARVALDFDGYVTRFISRCNRILWTDRFVKLWLRRAGDDAEERVEGARSRLRNGDAAAASLELILAAQVMTGPTYALWRKLPESISRGVTRFLAAAAEMREQEVSSHFLSAARLSEDEVGERFAATPPAGQRERDVCLAIRRGNGESLDALGATRDLLHISLWVAVTLDRSLCAPYPLWTGVTADEQIVRRQLDAAQAMLARLQGARADLEAEQATARWVSNAHSGESAMVCGGSPERGMPVLYIIATPIGNLEDISHRAVRVLGELEALACEDTRRTRILLDRYHIPRPKKLFSYHEHNEKEAAARILGLLEKGTALGLVTKAGYPGVSDPGYRVISQAVERGFRVEVLPGAGAVETALVLSGLPGASFTFKGFPPRGASKRRRFLEAEKELPHTLILFESPRRFAALLADALAVLGDRKAAVCIEITKMFEEVARGYLSELAEKFRGTTIKGEVTVVIAGNNPKFMKPEEKARDAGSP